MFAAPNRIKVLITFSIFAEELEIQHYTYFQKQYSALRTNKLLDPVQNLEWLPLSVPHSFYSIIYT